MADKGEMIAELRQRVANIPPLEEEPEFITSEETIVRYLKSRDWHVDEAERMLRDSVEYRRRKRPQTLDCDWCHNRPGFHSMRQVGHDEAGRPVIYANFAQASTIKNTTEDSVTHVTYLIENAKRTMVPGVSTWVFVIDCTGMTLSSCNPKLGYGVTNVLSNHYPERLGLVVCLNHSPVFHGVWKAIKKFLHPHTAAKVRMVRSKAKMAELFAELFSPELSEWLLAEIALNKHKPLPQSQQEFWNPPPPADGKAAPHDPRGCPTYVRQYIDTFQPQGRRSASRPVTPEAQPGRGRTLAGQTDPTNGKLSPADPASGVALAEELQEEKAQGQSCGKEKRLGKEAALAAPHPRPAFFHKPHPNIVDQLSGRRVAAVGLTREEQEELLKAQALLVEAGGSAVEATPAELEEDGMVRLDIPAELQIPANALPLTASS